MKKFKTVNNWLCVDYIRNLCAGNFRACCFLMYNCFDDCLTEELVSRMCKYFFDYVASDTFNNILPTLSCDVRSFVVRKYKEYENNK